jgi:isopentenyl diphosphate isomerase/L-lactate dehydrogenase-like FMN-dependent dehydrogenase
MANNHMGFYNIEDLRLKAKKRLPSGVFKFVDGGAEDEIAVQNNRDAYTSLKIKNRVLVDVSKRSTKTSIFGKEIAMPYGISPTGTVGLMNYGGEVGVAKAAAKMGVPCTVATNAQTPMEEIWEEAGGNLWFQLYMWSDHDLSMEFVKKVQGIGFETLIVTVDGPVGPNREYNKRNGYSMPVNFSPRLISQLLAKPAWLLRVLAQTYLRRGAPTVVNLPPELRSKITAKVVKHTLTKSDMQSWDDLRRIRDIWKGNLIIKGLQSAEDAVIAANEGCEGVILSNHGGRYVDCAPAPLQVLPEVRAAVGDRIKVIIDSGARRGSDIVKAIALGADMVMSGRPTLWGAAAAGTEGSYRALEIFMEETDRIMAQLGINSVDEIGPQIFWNPPNWVPRVEAALKAAAE